MSFENTVVAGPARAIVRERLRLALALACGCALALASIIDR